jgi:dTDP-4-amino-4,6-dideoxygalactose transaminase
MWPGVASAEDLQTQLKARYGALRVLLTDSGTTALRLAMAAGTGRSALVAIPAYGCYDLATAADGAGCRVVLYDVDPTTLSADLDSLAAVLRAGAEIVIAAHLYGYPVDVVTTRHLCAQFGALLVEDAAQAAGGILRDRELGSWGSLVMLSFGRGKGVTGGGGGALLARDERGVEVLSRVEHWLGGPKRGWSSLAKLAAQWGLARPEVYGLPTSLPFLRLGETVYRRPRVPRRASAATIAVLARTLPMADREVEIRRLHACRLVAALSASRALSSVVPIEGANPGYLRLPVLANERSGSTPPQNPKLGVVRAYPQSLADLEGFSGRIQRGAAGYAGARLLAARLVTLPTHSLLREADLAAIERWLAGLG